MSQTYKTRPDYILLFIVFVLLSFGVLMIFSASPTMAMRLGNSYHYLNRHIIALLIGFIALYAGFKLDYKLLGAWSLQIILATIVLLLIVLVPGVGAVRSGASRWIYFGIFSFQPAELAKLALIIYLARELSVKQIGREILRSLGMIAAIIAMVLKQPDVGTGLVITAIAFSMFYIAGAKMKYIYSLIAASIMGLILLSIAAPYRMRRLFAFFNPWSDPSGRGYHIIQSLIAVGSGGGFGLGLGKSMQKFFYLPQNYSDFIYAILCEELGLVGAVTVALLFFVFVGRGIKIARNAPDSFSMLLAGGIVSWIGFQALLNMSVVLAVAPTTGIPLPFVSYGGTSIVTMLFAVGLLLNISQFRIAEERKMAT